MSRRILIISLVALIAAGVSVAGEEGAWFDMQNCAMCKNLTDAEVIDHISWNQYNINAGIVSIANVDAKYLDTYREAHEGMNATGQRMMAGEKLDMCGSCTALGMCFMKGAQAEYVETETGDLMIMTSDNPELVKELQHWAARNKEEMKKMMGEAEGHDGHDHG
jgi:hypothetical protein